MNVNSTFDLSEDVINVDDYQQFSDHLSKIQGHICIPIFYASIGTNIFVILIIFLAFDMYSTTNYCFMLLIYHLHSIATHHFQIFIFQDLFLTEHIYSHFMVVFQPIKRFIIFQHSTEFYNEFRCNDFQVKPNSNIGCY